MNALEIDRLSYGYDAARPVLREVSLTVAAGERVGLIGPNGAGKLTLLLHLNGLLPRRLPDAPAVRVLGAPVREPHLAAIGAQVGLLFQDPDDQLFCPTVGEDVAFGPEQLGLPAAEVAARVERALRQVRLEGFAARAPHHLSRGEKRRVCIAGLLACEARLLALDEPSTYLDPRGRRELVSILAALPAAQLIATHDLELVVALCSRVVLLDAGEVVAAGPTAAILGDEALMLAHGLERPHILGHAHPHLEL